MASRRAVLPVVALAAALAGCGDSSDPGSTSAGADTATGSPTTSAEPTAPASSSPERPAPSSSDAESTSPPAGSTSSPTGAPSSTAPQPTVAGNGAQPAVVTAMAQKVGCPSPRFQNTRPGTPAAKLGSKGAVQCQVASKGYFVISVNKGNEEALVKALKSASRPSGAVPYLKGDGWLVMAVNDVKSQPLKFSRPLADDAKRKIGSGTVATV